MIICAYTLERWEVLTRAIDAVGAQTRPASELILVIDANPELQRRCEGAFPVATVLANRHPGGASGGRRTGGEAARSPILAFLDDDAIPDRVWLEEMLTVYDDPAALGAGGRVDPWWERAEPAWLPPELLWIVGCTYAGMPVEDGRIRNPIAANMSVRADVLSRTGDFSAALGRTDTGRRVSGTAEETELAIRATRGHPGGYWAYRPRARVRHRVPAARTTWRYFVGRCRLEGTAKAVLTGLTGTEEGLSAERRYVRSVLPRAVARELASAARGRHEGIARAGAIVTAVAVTAFAYLTERLRLRLALRRGAG